MCFLQEDVYMLKFMWNLLSVRQEEKVEERQLLSPISLCQSSLGLFY